MCSCNSADSWSADEMALINNDEPVMRVLTVQNTVDSLVLRTPCADINADMVASEEYSRLASKMIATVTSPEQDGVGIAGPQVGISRRIVAVMRYDKEGKPFEVFPNVRISAFHGDKVSGPEGCLSVPGRRGEVARYRDVEISYIDPQTLCDTSERVTGYTAVIFQHECDHLDGVIYTDKLVEE